MLTAKGKGSRMRFKAAAGSPPDETQNNAKLACFSASRIAPAFSRSWCLKTIYVRLAQRCPAYGRAGGLLPYKSSLALGHACRGDAAALALVARTLEASLFGAGTFGAAGGLGVGRTPQEHRHAEDAGGRGRANKATGEFGHFASIYRESFCVWARNEVEPLITA